MDLLALVTKFLRVSPSIPESGRGIFRWNKTEADDYGARIVPDETFLH